MRFTAPTGSGRRQDRLGTFRDRLTLVFGNGREEMNGQVCKRGVAYVSRL